MTAPRGRARRLEPRGPAADHQNMLSVRCFRQRRPGHLTAAAGIVNATDIADALLTAEAGFIAIDAGADIIGAVVLYFSHDFRLGDVRANHYHHVGITLGDDPLGLVGVADLADREDGDI